MVPDSAIAADDNDRLYGTILPMCSWVRLPAAEAVWGISDPTRTCRL
jgi:hypothetical protein